MADFARNKQVILPGTVEDPTVFKEIRRALQELGYAMSAPEPHLAQRKWYPHNYIIAKMHAHTKHFSLVINLFPLI